MAKKFNQRLRDLDKAKTQTRPAPPPPGFGRRALDDEPPLELAGLILFGLIGTVILAGLATVFGLRNIEADLSRRTRAAPGRTRRPRPHRRRRRPRREHRRDRRARSPAPNSPRTARTSNRPSPSIPTPSNRASPASWDASRGSARSTPTSSTNGPSTRVTSPQRPKGYSSPGRDAPRRRPAPCPARRPSTPS